MDIDDFFKNVNTMKDLYGLLKDVKLDIVPLINPASNTTIHVYSMTIKDARDEFAIVKFSNKLTGSSRDGILPYDKNYVLGISGKK